MFDVGTSSEDPLQVDPPPLHVDSHIKEVVDLVEPVLPGNGVSQMQVSECVGCGVHPQAHVHSEPAVPIILGVAVYVFQVSVWEDATLRAAHYHKISDS